MTRSKKWLLGILAVFFIFLIPATAQIYHQDEYSWLKEMDRTSLDPHVHPPLYFLLGRAFGLIFGFGHERWLPALFAMANILLVYAIAAALTGRKNIGLVAAGLFALSAYSVLAATQIDIDGSLLPFFILLTYLAYLHLQNSTKRWYWILALAIIGGLLTKLSYLIGFFVLIVDWGIQVMVEKNLSFVSIVRKYLAWIVGGILVLAGVYLVMGYFSPGVVSYAFDRFKIFDFGHRAYLDLGFKILKSIVLLGPLTLLAGLTIGWRPSFWYRYRFFVLYLIACVLFYAVIFDFTTLTIERYFMFMIAPFAILAAEPVVELWETVKNHKNRSRLLAISVAVLVGLAFVASLPTHILPLDPKKAYVENILAGHVNFNIPIMGGSGPIGFYVSALLMGTAWLVALIALLTTRYKRESVRAIGAAVFLCSSLFLAVIVLEEFLFGGIYGSPNNIAWKSVEYVNSNPAIQQVITYYDIANYDLRLSGKYYSRFYTAPTRDYTAKLTNFRGYYMVVDFPAIGKDTLYWHLLERCPIIKQFDDKDIHSYIFDCHSLSLTQK